MSNTTYETVPLVIDKDSSDKVKWFGPGCRHTGSQTPSMGNTAAFKSDVTWGFSGNEDVQERPGVKFSGTNGKDHYATYEFGFAGSNLYCPAHRLNGFSLYAAPNSNRGHALFFRRMGLKLKNKTGREQFWGSATFDKKSGYDWMQYTRGFNLGEIETLENYMVTALVIEISTASGTGTVESQLQVGGFKLHYSVHGPSNARWVVGQRRNEPFNYGGYVDPKGFYY